MKKNALLFIFSILSFSTFGQFDCNFDYSENKKDDVRTLSTDVLRNVCIVKRMTPSDTNYMVIVRMSDDYLIDNPKGLKLIIEDNNSISIKDAAVSVSYNEDKVFGSKKYLYTCYALLEEIQVLDMFLYKTLGVKIDILSGTLSVQDMELLQKQARCIFHKK